MIRRCVLVITIPLLVVCLVVVNTAFALGDTCSNVDIKLTNKTAGEIKVTKFEYYDYADDKWRTEVMFGLDGHQKLESGKSWTKRQDLEHVENDDTKFKVTYEGHIGGTKWSTPVSKTTSVFTCKDNMSKEVIIDTEPPSEFSKNCDWTVKGKVAVEHQLTELQEKFGTKSYLKGIKVNVSAKEKVVGVWGTYNSWGDLTTNANGEYSVTKEKNCDNRQFKVEVKFQDNDLEVRHEHSTSNPLTDVKWYTIIEDNEMPSGTVDFGDRTFKAGGANDLDDFEARRHADIWKLYQLAIEHMESMGSEFAFTTQIKVKHPHNGITGDSVESNYANPTTKVIYIIKNSQKDSFNVTTLFHELGHIWAYNHTSGEICLTETLLLDGGTHGLVDDHCVAFHEGFAEWWKDMMREELFGKSEVLPFSRRHLASGGVGTSLTNISLMQRHDDGWLSVFHTLTLDSIHKYDFGTSTSGSIPTVAVKSVIPLGCSSPSMGMQKVLKVFNEASNAGFPKKLSRDETTISTFLARVDGILNTFSQDNEDLYKDLIDPSKTVQPSDKLCNLTLTPHKGVLRAPKGPCIP